MQPGIFPGRQSVLDRFRPLMANSRLSQAYLFVGPEGAGKEVTSLEIARLVNCPRQPHCSAPPFCESCQKAISFQHPDIRWLGPAPATISTDEVREVLELKRENPFYQPNFATTSQVTIGDPDDPGPLTVRTLLRFLRMQPFQGPSKIAIVADAHRLTDGAANAFLKTLEEPPPASLIFLLTSNRSGMLPTIASRCQHVRFDLYSENELMELLVTMMGIEREKARDIARITDGNARKAVALLEPQTVALRKWAFHLWGWIHAGRSGSALVVADQLHTGTIPAEMAAAGGEEHLAQARDNPAKRERAILLCEMLNLYYSEVLSCRERQAEWRPRLVAEQEKVRDLARWRRSTTLLQDIAEVDAAIGDIDHNLNIGLTMAVLFEGLIEHAKRDQAALV